MNPPADRTEPVSAADGRSSSVSAGDGRSLPVSAVEGRSLPARAVEGRAGATRAADRRTGPVSTADGRTEPTSVVNGRANFRSAADGGYSRRLRPIDVWRTPAVLAAMSLVGLITALLGDGVWDATSWLLLTAPIAVAAYAILVKS